MKYTACPEITELPPGTMKPVDVDGHEILLANIDGSYFAVSRKCTHMGDNLCNGSLDGKVVTCPRHGARFDVTSGQAVGKAKLLFMSTMPGNLACFPVKLEGGQILIAV